MLIENKQGDRVVGKSYYRVTVTHSLNDLHCNLHEGMPTKNKLCVANFWMTCRPLKLWQTKIKRLIIPSKRKSLLLFRRRHMAQLQLSELGPAGSELFQDSESFLEELSDRELDFITGGNDLETVVTQNSQTVGSINTVSVVGISATNVSVHITNVNASNVNVDIGGGG